MGPKLLLLGGTIFSGYFSVLSTVWTDFGGGKGIEVPNKYFIKILWGCDRGTNEGGIGFIIIIISL
jgi:hypothetical protein